LEFNFKFGYFLVDLFYPNCYKNYIKSKQRVSNMAYMSQQHKQELAPTIKAILKKYNLNGSLAVRDHSTLVLTIKSGKIDFIDNYYNTMKERPIKHGNPVTTRENYLQVNTYWVDKNFTGEAKKCLEELIAAMKGPKFFDHSDAMIDYFHVSHHIDINIGKWNKPYIVTK